MKTFAEATELKGLMSLRKADCPLLPSLHRYYSEFRIHVKQVGICLIM